MSDRVRAELWLARGMLAFAVAALIAAVILPFRARCSRGINEAPLPAVSPEAALCEYACDRNALREAELNELRDIIGSPATGDELPAGTMLVLLASAALAVFARNRRDAVGR